MMIINMRLPTTKTLTSIFIMVVMCLTAGLSYAQPAYALSPEQRQIYDLNIGYFDLTEKIPPRCKPGAGDSTNLDGNTDASQNAKPIWDFFIGKGFSPEQTAGIMGNFQHESGLNPDQHQIGGPAYGLAQWEGGRRTNLEQFASDQGKDVSNLGLQLDFVMHELNGDEGRAYSEIQKQTTVPGATISWLDYYERAGVRAEEERKQNAEDFFARFSNGSGSGPGSGPSSGTTTCTNSSGQVVGDYSLPVDRRWYDEQPVWFSKPHHTYPASDLPVPEGTPIYAMHAGTVVDGPDEACGKGVIVQGDDGATYIYCHGSDGGDVEGARIGDKVKAGQLIMHSSYTGNVRPPGPDGTHLHLGIEKGGSKRCPQPLFKGIAEGSPPDINTLPTSGCVG